MVLVLFICTILFIFIILLIFILLSSLNIKINNYNKTNLKKEKNNYELILSLYLLNKFKWLSFKFDKKKLHKISLKMHLDKIDIKKLERDFKISDIKNILKIQPKLTFLDLDFKVGLEDIILTTYLIPIISSILSIILPFVTENKNVKNIKYKIEPIYNQKNLYYLKISTSVEIKIINLLNSIYCMYKSRKKDVPNRNRVNLKKNIVKCNV